MKRHTYWGCMAAAIVGGSLAWTTAVQARSAANAGGLAVVLKPEQREVVAGKPQRMVVKIDLTGPKTKPTERLPLNIAVVLDRSGSMGGAKIEQARQAAIQLVDQLQVTDTFSLIAYDTEVEVLIPAQPVEEKDPLKKRIATMRSGGSTALHAGVKEGGEQLKRYLDDERINRVILLSDGLANIGPSSNQAIATLGRDLAKRGMSVTTIGLGADYNEDLMAALAEASDANYYYVQDTETLPAIFAEELEGLLAVTARKVIIEITVPEGVKPIRLIGRDETFRNRRATVEFGPITAGQNRYVLLECDVPAGKTGTRQDLADVSVTYDDVLEGRRRTAERQLAIEYVADEKQALASVDADVKVDAELQRNASTKYEAIALADAGQNSKASEKLMRQAEQLRAAATAAPAARARELEAEAASLEQTADEVETKGLSRSERKVMQSDAYRVRNAK